ncbi:MAG: sulfur-oxidizing protein SoxZ [Phenylobacterium sp.]|jgi:sulfur-oxidizing protein SoxZ
MKIKVKAKEKKGIVKVKMLVQHPMKTGRTKDANGVLIPAHHLTEVKVDYKGDTVFHGEFGTAVSKDPFMAFSFKGSKGDSFKISAVDNQGKTGTADGVVK